MSSVPVIKIIALAGFNYIKLIIFRYGVWIRTLTSVMPCSAPPDELSSQLRAGRCVDRL